MIRTTLAAAALALALAMPAVAPAHADAHSQGWVTKDSPHDVATTRDKFVAAVENAGATVFAVVDHQANAKGADLEMAPATLVIFGNPKIGTPIMNADIKSAIDLPIRVLIWKADGKTQIGTLSPDTFKARYSVDAASEPLAKMGGALEKLMGAATAE